MRKSSITFPALFACLLLLGSASHSDAAHPSPTQPLPPSELPELNYDLEFFPGAVYNLDIPTPEELLGFPIGRRAANSIQIERCLKAWAEAAPDRTRLVEYTRSHEDRPLHYIVVSSPENIERLEKIQADLAKLGDPRQTDEDQARQLIEQVPPVAWMAYAIHGDETEGSDAALAVLYHLVAADDPAVRELLEKVVVVIDPLMNPDGRDRFLKMIEEHRGAMPNVDNQSFLHTGYWPFGRGNHYLFDLNRDWILGVHPETRGRIREIHRWNPVLLVDAHGMGAQDTHLFSPAREPLNVNFPRDLIDWSRTFARDQARAFDRHGLVYYTREWLEDWYPGYTTSWSSLRGAIGILYEQARIAEDGVRRPEGRILSYREAVDHHVIGSMANLRTLEENARELLTYFYESRREALDQKGRFATRTFAILPTENESRLARFIDALELQGLELFQAGADFTVPLVMDSLGRELKDQSVPAGTLLVPNRQPLGHLVAAMLEFDPRMSEKALHEERRELLRTGRSTIYDNTAWNLPMMYGLEALTLQSELPPEAEPYQRSKATPNRNNAAPENPVAHVIHGADDRSVSAAARLMERKVQVRIAEKDFQFEKEEFPRGSVVITRIDNRSFAGDLGEVIEETGRELGLKVRPVRHGLGMGDSPDLGGRHFKRLEPPRIALLAREGFAAPEFGMLWHFVDQELGIRHSHLLERAALDLRRYNVLVIPPRWWGELGDDMKKALREWIRTGGTLIAIGNATRNFIDPEAELSKVRALPEVLDKLAEYEVAVLREWQARVVPLPAAEHIWSHHPIREVQYPWPADNKDLPNEEELKRRDAWQTVFMPQGAILATRIDNRHWLTFGCPEPLPVLTGRIPVLMAASEVEAPIRFGYLNPGQNQPEADSDENSRVQGKLLRIGWSVLPEDHEMLLRMSGLLWPEATHRIANSAFVTRESFGRGQIILFAGPPVFRGYSHGTARVFANALIYGPGFGASQPIVP